MPPTKRAGGGIARVCWTSPGRDRVHPLRHVSLCLILTGVSAAAPFDARVDAPCDSTQAAEHEEPPVQIGVRWETRADSCRYVYTVLNRSQDTLTAVQVG